jgi:hypothetical protein
VEGRAWRQHSGQVDSAAVSAGTRRLIDLKGGFVAWSHVMEAHDRCRVTFHV